MKQSFFIKSAMIGSAVFIIAAGSAYFLFSRQQDELAGAFCPGMANEKIYKEKRVQTYATLIPGRNGWIFRTKNDFRNDWHIKQDTLQRLLSLQDAMRDHNAELVIVMPPVRGMIHTRELFSEDKKQYGLENPQQAWNAYETFINEMRSSGIHMVGINRGDVNENFFYKRNHHWSAEGARIAAEKIAANIRNIPQYTKIPKIKYVSRPLDPKEYKSSYDRAFQKICGTNIPPEIARNYETQPAENADAGALFDENAAPQVVLLGTSNSVPESSQANFEGFLKEYLSADVLNMAIAGAGIDTSIIAYLNSAHYKNNAPKIVIWEIPGYYNLDVMADTVLAQAIPAAHGDCGNDAVVNTTFTNIVSNSPLYASEDGRTYGPFPTGEDPRQANLERNDGLYLRLSFSEPVKKEFSLKFHYKMDEGTGRTKLVKFKRSNRYPADGEFYTAFPRMDKQAKLNKIRLVLPENMPSATVSAQICALPGSAAIRDDESM